MKVLQTLNRVPPGGWRYHIPELGVDVKRPQWAFLVEEVRNAYLNNGKKIPKNLEWTIQDYLCDQIPVGSQPGWCIDASPPSMADMLKRATHALSEWAQKGFPLTTEEQLVERREICEQCPMWKPSTAFGLGACGACGCTGLKLTVATEKCPQGKWKELA